MTRVVVAVLAVVSGLGMAACGVTSAPTRILFVPGMVGHDMQLEVVDNTGDLVGARALSAEELAAVDEPRLNVDRPNLIDARQGSTSREVLIVWAAFGCETSQLMISAPNKITITPGPIGTCDVVGNYRAVVLTFRDFVNASGLQLELLPPKTP